MKHSCYYIICFELSYSYIPSAPRVNYSLLVMESAGMMKMATGDGFPLRQGAGTGC